MKLFKLRKQCADLSNPKVTESLVIIGQNVACASFSCQDITRQVHCKSFEPWTEIQEAQILQLFKEKTRRVHYSLMTKKAKEKLLYEISNKVGRSPAAILIRLRSLNADTSRRSVSLNSIVGT